MEKFYGKCAQYGGSILSNCYGRFSLLRRLDNFLKSMEHEGLGQKFMDEVCRNEAIVDDVMTKKTTQGNIRADDFLAEIHIKYLNYWLEKFTSGSSEEITAGSWSQFPGLCLIVSVIEKKFADKCNTELLSQVNIAINLLRRH